MLNATSLVYKISAMSYLPGVDSVKVRAQAEAELIHHITKLQSEMDSMRAERDALLARLSGE